MSAVEYQNISKKYGSVTVMEDVSLSIGEGRFVVLLGPSGCGKTTLLRMTAGLEKITSGDILFSGNRVNDVHPRDRDIAMVFQSYALYPQMKVYDNIAFSLQVRKESKELIDQRVQEAAEILDLSPYLDRYPKALSGGQRQRVAMGRALVRHPKVFLFDEPLSNLDAKLRGQMRYEIRKIHNKLDTTTIYVTHDQIEAMTMADDIVVMRDGVIEQMGTPDDIYQRPVNAFVADFIGTPSINFIDASLDQSAGHSELLIDGETITLPNAVQGQHQSSVTVGVRPLDLTIDEASRIRGTVEFVENTGADKHIHLKVNDTMVRIVSTQSSKYVEGDVLGIGVDPRKLHVFDKQTQQRVN